MFILQTGDKLMDRQVTLFLCGGYARGHLLAWFVSNLKEESFPIKESSTFIL